MQIHTHETKIYAYKLNIRKSLAVESIIKFIYFINFYRNSLFGNSFASTEAYFRFVL